MVPGDLHEKHAGHFDGGNVGRPLVPFDLVSLVISLANGKCKHLIRFYSGLVNQFLSSLHTSGRHSVFEVFAWCRSLTLDRVGERKILRH